MKKTLFRERWLPGSETSSVSPSVADQTARADAETEALLIAHQSRDPDVTEVNRLGAPLRRSPFSTGFMAALGVLLAYGLVHVLLNLAQVLTLIVVALFLALGLEPLVSGLMRRGFGRGRAVLLIVLSLSMLIAGIGWLVVPTVVEQVGTFVDRAPGYLDHLQHTSFVMQLDARFHIVHKVKLQAHSGLSSLTMSTLLGGVLGAGKAVLDVVVAVITVFVLTLYLMVALPSVKTAAYKLVPQGRRARVVFLGEEISRRVGGYVLGQAVLAVTNGVLTYLMLILLGLPFSAVLALVVGLLALLPIVGTVIGGVIITLVALSVSWATAFVALGYYIAYHLVESYVLSPRIMHRAVGVPPIVVILAVLAGGTLLGVIGALIAIPIAAGLSLIYEQVLVPRQQAFVGTP
jgi:predicted PurR-regulated permease PerM